MTNKEVVKNFYYSDSLKLDIRLNTWKKFGTNKKSFIEWILGMMNLKGNPNLRLLDVGCGTGDLLYAASKINDNLKIYGVDISKAMIYRTKIKNFKFKKNFIVGEAEKIPFNSAFFDRLVSVHTLHHVPNIKKAIKEFYRVIKPGGLIIIVTGNYNLDKGFNKLHYQLLKKLNFPSFMLEKDDYLRFSGSRALQYFLDLNIPVTKCRYTNNLNFRSVKPALDYYKSAMMYRNSMGLNDVRIKKSQWQELTAEMELKISGIIKRNGSFVVPGEVSAYKIIKNV